MAVKILTGQVFGRLMPTCDYRIVNRKAEWLCDCTCGSVVWVRGTRMTQGKQVSCGCQRADPAVRRAARLVTSPKRRKAISVLGGKALSKARRMASLARKTKSGGRNGGSGGTRPGAGRQPICDCGACRTCYMREAKRRSRARLRGDL